MRAKRDLEQSATAEGSNRYVPDHVIDKYGADALRLWATKARIGSDDEQWVSDRAAMDKMVTVLDVVCALRAQHKLGNSAHFAKLLLDPRIDGAKDFAAVIAAPLRVAARARHVVFEAADHDSSVEGLMVGIVA